MILQVSKWALISLRVISAALVTSKPYPLPLNSASLALFSFSLLLLWSHYSTIEGIQRSQNSAAKIMSTKTVWVCISMCLCAWLCVWFQSNEKKKRFSSFHQTKCCACALGLNTDNSQLIINALLIPQVPGHTDSWRLIFMQIYTPTQTQSNIAPEAKCVRWNRTYATQIQCYKSSQIKMEKNSTYSN